MNTELAISLVAVLISFVALVRARKVGALEAKLTTLETRLAEHAIAEIDELQEAKSKTSLHCELEKHGKMSWKILIRNEGISHANNVCLESIDKEVLVAGDADLKLPAHQLKAGKEIRLLAAITYSCSPPIGLSLSWINPDGTASSESFVLQFP